MKPGEEVRFTPCQPGADAGFWARGLRDFHLYTGLFISPFVVVFAVSVFFMVHPSLRIGGTGVAVERSVAGLSLPADLERLSGRERIEALRPALDQARVHGEVGWIGYYPRENRLVIPVSVPGRLTTVAIDLAKREALVREQATGIASALVELHKAPGPHLVDIRGNWFPMRVWAWLADATVYLLLFTTLSGLYLWWRLRRERPAGLMLLGAGAVSFVGLLYALVH